MEENIRLIGYIDESFTPGPSKNARVFTLSCIFSTRPVWHKLQVKWKAVIRKTNRALRKQRRPEISRYHATYCSALKGEFAGWTIEEQIKLTKQLIATIKKNMTSVIAMSMPLDDFVAVYPERKENVIQEMHGFLLKFMMSQLMHDIETQAGGPLKPFTIEIIHDRSDHDVDMLGAFNSIKNDVTFKGREHFATIQSKGWEDCIPLQAADLLAYETFRDAVNKISSKPRRKSLASLFEPNTQFGGHSLSFNRKSLEMLREYQERGVADESEDG